MCLMLAQSVDYTDFIWTQKTANSTSKAAILDFEYTTSPHYPVVWNFDLTFRIGWYLVVERLINNGM